MSFSSELLSSREGKFSAYFQYMSGRGREGYMSYAFVEDEDDISFYQHVLSHITDVCFLGCGGKDAVFDIFRRLSDEGYAGECLFFVDRDIEQEPFPDAAAILRTWGYSWENHTLVDEAVRPFVIRKLAPMPSLPDANDIVGGWKRSFENFGDLLKLQLALIIFALRKGRNANVSDIIMSRDALHEGFELRPHPEREAELLAARNELVNSIEEDVEINEIIQGLGVLSEAREFRGKSAFLVFRQFVVIVLSQRNCTCRVAFNSPLAVVCTIPSDHEMFDYIREYVANRRANAQPLVN